MLIMPSNNTGFDCGYIAGTYPGRIGHLHNCDSLTEPRMRVPWALDNGVFGAWSSGREWSPEPLFRFLDKYADYKPMWVVCPDWVADRHLTLERWDQYEPAIRAYGVNVAFVVQDGMDIEDVPDSADCIFVGGTTSWKWRNAKKWKCLGKKVHIGRVNTYNLLWQAHDCGADSCDGTGWFRGDKVQIAGLIKYLEESTKGGRKQLTMMEVGDAG